MSDAPKSERTHITDARDAILDAAALHVVFDGWSEKTLRMAASDAGVDWDMAQMAFPRGGVDLALAFHLRGDRALEAYLAEADLSGMGMTAKITHAVRKRLEIIAGEKEAVRRASSLLALPIYATDGARAIWGTADVIWSGLGDTSDDINWYSKRATLSGVYGATVLYWLGDESEGNADTWAFLDRRIGNVMQIEKAKGQLRGSALGKAFEAGPGVLLSKIRKPGGQPGRPLPGRLG